MRLISKSRIGRAVSAVMLAAAAVWSLLSPALAAEDCPALLDHRLRPLAQAEPQSLCRQHAGKVLLVVNTASFCGFTPQYRQLEALYERYRERGLVVLGFPSNDFSQEPGSEAEIKAFCDLSYQVKFPMYEKLAVRGGERAHPLFRQLAAAGGGEPRWNFHKYLVGRDGERVFGFPSRVEPDDADFLQTLESLL